MHAVESMVSGGGVQPWHKLGKVVEGTMTAAEALELSGLDWEVEKRQDFYYNNDGSLAPAPGYYKIVRTDRLNDNVLGSCTSLYTPLQNCETFSFFDPLVSRKEAIYHTAGSLMNGRRVWILAQLPGEIVVNGRDTIGKYVLLTNGHDGKSSFEIKLTPIRVVCWNTLSCAMYSGERSYKVRHTSNVVARVQEAATVMGFANKMYAELQESFQALANKRIGQDEATEYFEEVVGDIPKKLAKIEELYETGAGAEMARGTLWGAYNAVTEYVDHAAKYRGGESRLNQIWFADAADLKVRALERALELAV